MAFESWQRLLTHTVIIERNGHMIKRKPWRKSTDGYIHPAEQHIRNNIEKKHSMHRCELIK